MPLLGAWWLFRPPIWTYFFISHTDALKAQGELPQLQEYLSTWSSYDTFHLLLKWQSCFAKWKSIEKAKWIAVAAWNLRHSCAKRAQPAQAERQILRNRGPVTPAAADHYTKHGILIDSLTWRPTTSQHYNLSDCGHCVVMEGLFRSHQCLVHNKIAITEQMWPDKKQANSDWKHPFSAVCSNLSGHNHAKRASRFFAITVHMQRAFAPLDLVAPVDSGKVHVEHTVLVS